MASTSQEREQADKDLADARRDYRTQPGQEASARLTAAEKRAEQVK